MEWSGAGGTFRFINSISHVLGANQRTIAAIITVIIDTWVGRLMVDIGRSNGGSITPSDQDRCLYDG